MDEYNNNGINTDWDLTEFISSQQASKHSSTVPRPDFNQQEDDVMKGMPNGMDIFNTPPFAASHSEEFCTRTNIDSRLRYLNQEFSVIGLPNLFPKTVIAGRETEAKFDLAHLINGTYELLRTHKRQLKARDDLEAKQIRSESDNDTLIQSQSRLKIELEAAKREICVGQLREKKLGEQFKVLQQERKMEREEMKKMKSDMQHKHKQFLHESKRREKEMHKLKERLHQLLTDKSHDKRMGMEILNAIQRPDGKRKLWKTSGNKNEEEMYRLIISNYEEKHKELTVEITLLREYLADIQSELMSLVNENSNEKDADNREGSEVESKGVLENGHFHMPFHVVGEDMKNHFKLTWRQLKNRLEQNSSKGSSPTNDSNQYDSDASNKEIKRMKEQIENYRSIISKQEQILQSMQDEKMVEKIELYLRGDTTLQSSEEVKDREKHLKHEREKLLKERKVATELALKLAQDREDFEKERIEFYKNCISTPVISKEGNDGIRSHSKTSPRTKFHSATPVFSPAQRPAGSSSRASASFDPSKTPTTAELYRYMSLAINDDEDEPTISSSHDLTLLRSNVESQLVFQIDKQTCRRGKWTTNGEHDGSYLHDEHEKETLSRKESNYTNASSGSGNRGGVRKERVAEHAENVRRVLERMPRRNLEEAVAVQ